MPDLTTAQTEQLAKLRPVLFRLMDRGALADVVELLVELDRLAARSTPARHVTTPPRHTAPATWEQLLSPAERELADASDSEPHGLAVTRSLDVLEAMLSGGRA